MARLIESFDWSSTPLGPIEGWSSTMTGAIDLILGSPKPIVTLWGEAGVMIYNQAYSVFAGARHPQLLGSNVREGWGEIADFNDNVMRVGLAGGTLSYEDQELILDRDGHPDRVWMNLDYSPIFDETRAAVGVMSLVTETTGKVRAERDLRSSEARYRILTEVSPQVVWQAEADGTITYCNRIWYDLTGFTEAQTLGSGWLDAIHPDHRGRVADAWSDAIAHGDGWRIEVPFRSQDGGYRWHLAAGRPLKDAAGRTTSWSGIALEIEDRRNAEEALRAGEERYRAITDSVDQMIWSTLPDGFHDYYNQRWYDFTGMPPGSTDGEAWNGMFHPDDQDRAWGVWRHCLATGDPYHIEYRLRHRTGQYRWVIGRAQPVRDADGAITRWYGTCTDIHDLKMAEQALRELTLNLEERVAEEVAGRAAAEEALRQTQKMEAVGQLTGGIAHDFNNLLTIVTGNIDMAGRALVAAGEPDPRAQRALENAMKGAERAAALTQRLLAFARRQPLAPKQIDADRLIGSMSDLLKRALGEMVSLEVVTAPGLWKVEADPNQLESAILNLAVNARDAMPSGGSLVIETANARLDRKYARSHAEVAPGQYMMIAVTDTGSGMSRETIERVFEPFYTTKEVGKGTGLGLSMVYGFVKQSGGHIKVYSELGSGTTIKIYLPRLMRVQDDVEDANPSQGIELSQRQETILVVEDDDDVRAYTVEIIRELGYRVLEAHDGPSGLRLLERQGEPIDLLFTDVVMPGMSGAELAAAARRLQPDLRVLYTSGYTRNAIVHGGRLDPGVEMISKPFTYSAVASKIRDVLETGRTGRVLAVVTEPTVRALTIEALVSAGNQVDEAANGTEGLSRLRSAGGRYDVVMIDERVTEVQLEGLIAELRAIRADLPVLVAVADDARIGRSFSEDRGVLVLLRPFNASQLNSAIETLRRRGSAPG